MNKFIRNKYIFITVFCVLSGFIFLGLLVTPNYAAPSLFDWGSNYWPIGYLTQTYTGIGTPATDFIFTFSGDTSRLIESPVTNQIITGGLGSQNSLFIGPNFSNKTESISLTIDLSLETEGVSFTVMDIDTNVSGANSMSDEILVIGSNSNSGIVLPTLMATNPLNVTVAGNVATATNGAIDNYSDGGNVLVSFSSAVDQIIIEYRAGPGSSIDPIESGIALSDIDFDPMLPTNTPTPIKTPIPTNTPDIPPSNRATVYLPFILRW